MKFFLKLSDLKSDFTLTLGYLNPALNNPAQYFKPAMTWCTTQTKNKLISSSIYSVWVTQVKLSEAFIR